MTHDSLLVIRLSAFGDVIHTIPAVVELKKYGTDEALKLYLDDISSKCFPLLRWTIQSNRTQLAYIPPAKHLKVGVGWLLRLTEHLLRRK